MFPCCEQCMLRDRMTIILSLGIPHNVTSWSLSKDHHIISSRSRETSNMTVDDDVFASRWTDALFEEQRIGNESHTAEPVEVEITRGPPSTWFDNITGGAWEDELNSTAVELVNDTTGVGTFLFRRNFTLNLVNGGDYYNLTETTPEMALLEQTHIMSSADIRNFTDDITGMVNQNTTTTYYPVASSLETGLQNPALAVLLTLFCVFTIFGNILVMAAVARERYLHTVTNYFIVSLATADCLVGAIVMPFSAVHEAMHKFWIFGRDWCDVWHSVDVLGSTASILNLCVISLDRYWAITDPITYPSKMTTRKACILIGVVWVCASLISFPAIAWWRAVSKVRRTNSCVFTEDIGYLVFSSIISFYGPLTVMVFTYYRIYRAAAEQTRSLRLGTKQVLACNGEEAMELTLRIHRGGTATPSGGGFTGSNGNGGSGGKRGYHPVYPVSPISHGDISETLPLSIEDLGKNNSVRIVPKNLKHFSFSRKLARMAKEQKAAKTLGIVMGVFVLCWMPFFLCNVLVGLCSDQCFQDAELVSSVVTWLGWINSGMNPVIYACWSRDFRRAFTKILCGCCPRLMGRSHRQRLRSRVCQSISTPLSSTCSTECVRL